MGLFFIQNSSLYRVLSTKSVKESEEITYISLQSARSSFRKIQICNLRNGALVTFRLKPFGQKSSLHRVISTKNVKESEEISYISSEASRWSFRKIQICNLRNGALVTFRLKLFGQKSSLHRVVSTKSVKES